MYIFTRKYLTKFFTHLKAAACDNHNLKKIILLTQRIKLIKLCRPLQIMCTATCAENIKLKLDIKDLTLTPTGTQK